MLHYSEPAYWLGSFSEEFACSSLICMGFLKVHSFPPTSKNMHFRLAILICASVWMSVNGVCLAVSALWLTGDLSRLWPTSCPIAAGSRTWLKQIAVALHWFGECQIILVRKEIKMNSDLRSHKLCSSIQPMTWCQKYNIIWPPKYFFFIIFLILLHSILNYIFICKWNKITILFHKNPSWLLLRSRLVTGNAMSSVQKMASTEQNSTHYSIYIVINEF